MTQTLSAPPAKAVSKPAGRPRDGLSYAVYLIPSTVLFIGVILVPFVMNIGFSLTTWDGIGSPKWVGLDNYTKLLSDGAFWSSFGHNVALVIAMAIIPLMVGLVLASVLFDVIAKRFGPRTTAVLRACIYLPQVLPFAVAGIVWAWILAPDNGALNAVLKAIGLKSLQEDWLGDPKLALYTVMGVLVWVQIGFPLVVFMAGLQRVDPSLYEAADIDGASWWRKFWYITIPQIRPEIYVVLLTCTVAAIRSFDKVFILTRGGPGGATNVPAYYSYQNFFEKTQVGYGAAIATVLTLIIVVVMAVLINRQNKAEEADS
ncbi:carbohydrate ABC transporter permease [Actinoallomurus rhizosphaericola]|uniref:carbohydrate ABC transporter permease n=1 Tax=Actinoallomurus rhizosphaericola TaxID=2952536 RepID=UPI002093D70E|nr:sugar ABC transporter permease [Actinoallomurus rhizosphaericola]MCO5998897.1 sugar ABC transporter permease [Actinoallomurus rhizosphaericola]